jgi:predicted small lipoprotein YifL
VTLGRPSRRILCALALALLVGACGQKGPLYLPEKPQPVQPQPPAMPPAPDDVPQ